MQKALDDLVRHYIISETRYEKAEKENSPSDEIEEHETFEDEYIRALYECLENKGIVKELQTFLRQRLVSILQDKWPNLENLEENVTYNPIAVRLLQDFLCSHQLLYTFSVLSSELHRHFSTKNPFGKMQIPEAESILDQMEIKRKTHLHTKILECYAEKGKYSLLECIIYVSSWSSESLGSKINAYEEMADHNNDKKKVSSRLPQPSTHLHLRKGLDGKKELVEDKPKGVNKEISHIANFEKRLQSLEESIEQGKDNVVQKNAIEKYKQEDAERIQDEIEARLTLEWENKEKELLAHYEEKLHTASIKVEKEKEIWLMEKARQETALLEQRERIVLLMNSLNEKQQTVKHLLERYQDSIKVEDEGSRQLIRNYQLKEIDMESTIQKLKEENSILKKLHLYKENENRPHVAYHEHENKTYQKVALDSTNDTVAFLKYYLECQAEEIKSLRSELSSSPVTRQLSERHSLPLQVNAKEFHGISQSDVREKQLEDFLRESRRRCDEIEKEAKEVEKNLEIFRDRLSDKNQPLTRPLISVPSGRVIIRPSVPKTSVPLNLPPTDPTYFPTLLNQIFPSRDHDYSLGVRQREPQYSKDSIFNVPKSPEEFHSSTTFKESAAYRTNILSQLQANVDDFNKLVHSSMSDITNKEPAESKNIASIEVIPNSNRTSNQLINRKTISLMNTRTSKNTTLVIESKPQNHKVELAGGGDTTGGDKQFVEKTKDNSSRSINFEVKASESGALLKKKVHSPPTTLDQFDQSEPSVSISIHSVAKSKRASGVGVEAQIVVSPVINNASGGHPERLEFTNKNDVSFESKDTGNSISAPDISQSQNEEDFWNV